MFYTGDILTGVTVESDLTQGPGVLGQSLLGLQGLCLVSDYAFQAVCFLTQSAGRGQCGDERIIPVVILDWSVVWGFLGEQRWPTCMFPSYMPESSMAHSICHVTQLRTV